MFRYLECNKNREINNKSTRPHKNVTMKKKKKKKEGEKARPQFGCIPRGHITSIPQISAIIRYLHKPQYISDVSLIRSHLGNAPGSRQDHSRDGLRGIDTINIRRRVQDARDANATPENFIWRNAAGRRSHTVHVANRPSYDNDYRPDSLQIFRLR